MGTQPLVPANILLFMNDHVSFASYVCMHVEIKCCMSAYYSYRQSYDLEGETGIVVRGIGSCVRLAKNSVISFSIPDTPPTIRLAARLVFPLAMYPTGLRIM